MPITRILLNGERVYAGLLHWLIICFVAQPVTARVAISTGRVEYRNVLTGVIRCLFEPPGARLIASRVFVAHCVLSLGPGRPQRQKEIVAAAPDQKQHALARLCLAYDLSEFTGIGDPLTIEIKNNVAAPESGLGGG